MAADAQVASVLAQELGSFAELGEITRTVVRLSIAALLGGLLGYERERKGRAAGLKTHMLVSLGSALFVLVPLQAGVSQGDLTRVVQGIVSGIGFLGAGTILKGPHQGRVEGLTTAAGIWTTSAIGMAAGMGYPMTAVLCTGVALVIFHWVPRWLARGETSDSRP
ncbi:MgtC/SapB family protein [Tahibacter amnicola]|uniref:Protein MgtC n=1 Tax=Tahibacter amnicola TaxID=2976241 RepID=A0ABY6BE08_9GAMM|nr:MgtC/SapB family protein [Tahibacter amnicola]UXI68040.1 MgtC/SapB family protein [Tahibacter amnicola]